MSAKHAKSSSERPSALVSSKPNYAAWLRRDAFYRYEIALLATGVDPDSNLASDFLEAYDGKLPRRHSSDEEVQKAFKLFRELKCIVDRSFEGGALRRFNATNYLPRVDAVAFICETGLFCEPFREAAKNWIDNYMRTHDRTSTPPTTEPPMPKGLATRERATVLKLIGAMAIKGYRYDPKASRNGAVSDIASDIRLLGMSLDEDTIRKWLQEAASVVTEFER